MHTYIFREELLKVYVTHAQIHAGNVSTQNPLLWLTFRFSTFNPRAAPVSIADAPKAV